MDRTTAILNAANLMLVQFISLIGAEAFVRLAGL